MGVSTVLLDPPKVAIVGAGLAGLCAAYELNQAGYKTEIIEAASSPGGRILTLRAPFPDGLYAEAGPLSVPDNHFHALRYLREFDLPLEPIGPPSGAELVSIHRCRTIIGSATHCSCLKLSPEEEKLGFNGIVSKYLDGPAQGIGDPTQPNWPPQSLRRLDDISAEEFFREQGASRGALDLLHITLLDLYGEGLASCSALFILACEHLLLGSTRNFKVYGGMDLLPTRIAALFKETIYYGSSVTEIEQTGKGVRVHFMRAGGRESLAADYVICAIPFPVLRTIKVHPAFSPGKQAVIDGLENTSVSRVYLQTRSRFWEQQKLSGLAETDLGVMLLLPAYGRVSQRGILESYTAGRNARRLRDMTPEERSDFTVAEVAKVFPKIRSELEDVTFKCWDLDPYEKGAYAFFKPGQFVSFLPYLASPENRIFFAGDQTTMLPGWMEGAIQSGMHAALQVQQQQGYGPCVDPTPFAGYARAIRKLPPD